MKKCLIYIGIMLGIVCLVFGYQVKNRLITRIRYDLPITTKEVSSKPNTYGSYLAGFLAQQHQKYDDSIKLFDLALKTNPQNEKLKITLYLLKAVRGDIADILPLAQELQKLKQPELLVDYVLIADAIRNNDFLKAEKILSEKPSYGSDKMLKPLIQSWIELGKQNKKAAYTALKPLEKDPQTKVFYHYYRALIAMAFQDEKIAQESFEKMSQLSKKGYPSLTAVLFLREFYQRKGLWKAGQQDYDRVEKSLQEVSALQQFLPTLKAPKITPQVGTALAFYDISVALAPLKLQETCLILNELALYITPEALMPKIWGGELMESSGNYLAANRIYNRITNQNDLIRLKIAMNLIAIENYQEALPILEQLLQTNKDDSLFWFILGDVYAKLKIYDKALDSYTEAGKILHSLHKNSEEAQVKMAQVYIYEKQGLKDKVEKTIQESLALNPNNPQALNYLGYVWLERNYNIDEAFKMVQKALDLEPEDPNIMDSLALGYYLKKEYIKALELAEKATDQLSFSSVAYQHLGDIYLAMGRKREAIYQYQRALTLTEDLTPELKEKIQQKLSTLTAKKKVPTK